MIGNEGNSIGDASTKKDLPVCFHVVHILVLYVLVLYHFEENFIFYHCSGFLK